MLVTKAPDNCARTVTGRVEEAEITDQKDRATWTRVLLVEDDESHRIALQRGLEREGFAVFSIVEGRQVREAVERIHPSVILLDLMLPGRSGFEVCRELRASSISTPIIMLSARSDEVDIVLAMEMGADDYVTKPYRLRELVARMNAVLRRRATEVHHPVARDGAPEPLAIGDVILDSARHEVIVRGRAVEMPLREFQLLRELMEHAGHVVAREQLIDNVWGYEYDGDPRIIATIVGRLRTKIETDPDEPRHIVTIRGVGYRFNDRY